MAGIPTKNDLKSNTKTVSIELLNARLADAIDLALITKQAHWNVKGPQFIAVQQRDGMKGVQFVGIAVDQADKVREFANEIGLNYPALIGGFGAIELSKALGNDLAALPFTIVVDRAGKVAHTQLGPLKAIQLDDLLRTLLAPA